MQDKIDFCNNIKYIIMRKSLLIFSLNLISIISFTQDRLASGQVYTTSVSIGKSSLFRNGWSRHIACDFSVNHHFFQLNYFTKTVYEYETPGLFSLFFLWGYTPKYPVAELNKTSFCYGYVNDSKHFQYRAIMGIALNRGYERGKLIGSDDGILFFGGGRNYYEKIPIHSTNLVFGLGAKLKLTKYLALNYQLNLDAVGRTELYQNLTISVGKLR